MADSNVHSDGGTVLNGLSRQYSLHNAEIVRTLAEQVWAKPHSLPTPILPRFQKADEKYLVGFSGMCWLTVAYSLLELGLSEDRQHTCCNTYIVLPRLMR